MEDPKSDSVSRQRHEEMRQAQRELQISRDRYADLFEFAPVGYFTLNKHFQIMEANLTGRAMLGVVREDLTGRSLADFVAREHREAFHTCVKAGCIDGKANWVVKMCGKGSTPFFADMQVSERLESGGEATYRMTVIDVTERQRAEMALEESEQKFRNVFSKAAIGFSVMTPTGQILEANHSYCQIVGYSLEELRNMEFSSLVHPDDLAKNINLIDKLISDKLQDFKVENRYIRKDGDIRWVRRSVSAVYQSYGAIDCIVSLIEDITESKTAALVVERNERWFRALTEKTGEFIAILDEEGNITYSVSSSETSLLYSPEDLAGRNALDLVHVDDLAPNINAFRELIAQPEVSQQVELCVRAKDDSWRWLSCIGTNLLADQAVNGIVINGRDITKRKAVERELLQRTADLDRAQEVGHIGWWRLDIRQDILTWSDENYRIFGVPKGKPLTYQSFLDKVHPEDRSYVDARWKEGVHGEPYGVEHRIIVNHEVKWVREKAYMEFDDTGNPLEGFGITQDITDRKRLEEDLRRSRDELELRVQERTKKLSSVVKTLRKRSKQLRQLSEDLTLAEHRERQRLAQVLHDGLQQTLIAAKYQLELFYYDRQIPEELNQMRKLLEEASETSRSLAAELSPPVLLRHNLYDALEWLAYWARENHDLVLTLKTDGKVQILPEAEFLLLYQAARELLFNIVKHAGINKAHIDLSLQEGRVLMTVEDEGSGFDTGPLTASHDIWGGSGLFSISERFQLLGGWMEIDSAPGRGSRFRLMVPQSTETKKPAQTSTIESVTSGVEKEPSPGFVKDSSEMKIRIMLVDDHEIVRKGVANLLSKEPDFEIVGEAYDGASALNRARAIQPDVILMDINMPEMDGVQATRRIHEEFPDIFIIGFSIHEELQKREIIEAGAIAHLSKSGSTEELIKAIRSCV
jgi:PAS domain S-box-containing protein